MPVRYFWILLVLSACSTAVGQPSTTNQLSPPIDDSVPAPQSDTSTTSTTAVALTTTTTSVPLLDEYGRPAWLGTIILPVDDQGFGEVRPTPPELIGRAFGTVDRLAPPTGAEFEFVISPVPDEVLARSTWHEGCPVGVDDLSYVTVSHLGFDGRLHTGELLVHQGAADEMVKVFGLLFAAHYPIEEMRVVSAPELDLPPTGDGNNTTIFVCRPATGGTNWSQHAYGLAIDINPFQNPYWKGDLVLPELADYYTDRATGAVGIIADNDAVTEAFRSIGWGWGGDWSSLKDWMHFSRNGL